MSHENNVNIKKAIKKTGVYSKKEGAMDLDFEKLFVNSNVSNNDIKNGNTVKMSEKKHNNPYRAIEEAERARRESLAEYEHFQKARVRSGQKQTELLKGINEGKDPSELLVIALECISEATGNQYYKTVAIQKFIDIYGGGGLQHLKTVEIEMKQTKERLEKLREAAERKNNNSLNGAIEAHEMKIKELNEILKKQTAVNK